jgi:hypothetical protein
LGSGLAVAALITAAAGPFRDSWFMTKFREWGSEGAGIAPLLAISATHLALGVCASIKRWTGVRPQSSPQRAPIFRPMCYREPCLTRTGVGGVHKGTFVYASDASPCPRPTAARRAPAKSGSTIRAPKPSADV